MVQRGLIATVSIVLALIVITAFHDLLAAPSETIPPRTTTTVAAATTTEETTTTTTVAAATTTTDIAAPAVCLDEEPSAEATTVLRVYYPCGSEDRAIAGTYVYRGVPETDLVLTATLREMVKGLEPGEEAVGFRSPFPAGAEGSALGVTIDTAEHTAYVEFSDGVFPSGADTAEGAQILLSVLNANVFQFDTIDAVQYRLGGSCDAFWQRLGGQCEEITRADWQSQLVSR